MLEQRQRNLQLEQAVHGLDRCDEVELQALLHEGLRSHYAVGRELHYPSAEGKRSARRRCDLVLGPLGTPLDAGAWWLEVKVAHQRRAGGHHNARYAQQWRCALFGDLRKMHADARIAHAALVLVAFTDSQATFDRDIELFERLLFDEGLRAGYRSVRSFAIDDRIGHTRCSVAAWPL